MEGEEPCTAGSLRRDRTAPASAFAGGLQPLYKPVHRVAVRRGTSLEKASKQGLVLAAGEGFEPSDELSPACR
jgi:hypothetical protein